MHPSDILQQVEDILSADSVAWIGLVDESFEHSSVKGVDKVADSGMDQTDKVDGGVPRAVAAPWPTAICDGNTAEGRYMRGSDIVWLSLAAAQSSVSLPLLATVTHGSRWSSLLSVNGTCKRWMSSMPCIFQRCTPGVTISTYQPREGYRKNRTWLPIDG